MTFSLFTALLFATMATGLLLIWIASLDAFRFCFIQMKEGTAVEIQTNGTFDHFLLRYQGHRLNDPRRASTFNKDSRSWSIVQMEKKEEADSIYDFVFFNWLERHLRIYWIGLSFPPFNRRVRVRMESWVEARKEGSSGLKPLPRKEETTIWKVMPTTYWYDLHQLETKDGSFPVEIVILGTTKIVDLYEAAGYGNDDPMRLVEGMFEAAARKATSIRTFPEIVEEASINGKEFNAPFAHMEESMLEQTGYRFVEIRVLSVDPEGNTAEETVEIRRLFAEQKRAELIGKGHIATATAAATVTRTAADAKAHQIQVEGRATAEAAKLLSEARTGTPGQIQVATAAELAKIGANSSTLVLGDNIAGAMLAFLNGRTSPPAPTPPTAIGGPP